MQLFSRILMLVALLAALPREVHAYADPGTGTFIYQAAYAAILSCAFYARRFIARFWGRRK